MGSEAYFDRLVDRSALEAYLVSTLGPASRCSLEHHTRGHSNETLFLTWGDSRLVLRRPPPGEKAGRAHDVLREYRVIDALESTAVPVPRAVHACRDDSVIGCEFYLMERVAGDVLRDREPPRFRRPAVRERVGTELVDTLARIHTVDYEAVGLGDFGRPEGFTERQVERWRRQLRWAFERTASVRSVPELESVAAWLGENVPASHPRTLVHGDFKLDNVVYEPGSPPGVAAVLDWELSALGDPLTDLGWLLANWPTDGDPLVPGVAPSFLDHPGYPSRRDLIARYEAKTGIEYRRDRFYRTLATFKLAALGEMFFRRHLEGNAADDLYPQMETLVPELATRCHELIDGERDL